MRICFAVSGTRRGSRSRAVARHEENTEPTRTWSWPRVPNISISWYSVSTAEFKPPAGMRTPRNGQRGPSPEAGAQARDGEDVLMDCRRCAAMCPTRLRAAPPAVEAHRARTTLPLFVRVSACRPPDRSKLPPGSVPCVSILACASAAGLQATEAAGPEASGEVLRPPTKERRSV